MSVQPRPLAWPSETGLEWARLLSLEFIFDLVIHFARLLQSIADRAIMILAHSVLNETALTSRDTWPNADRPFCRLLTLCPLVLLDQSERLMSLTLEARDQPLQSFPLDRELDILR